MGRADEIYVETQRDRCSAKTLIDELNQALTQHPTRKMDTSLRARMDTLETRFSTRPDPKLNPGSFPQPSHALFPDQEQFNSSSNGITFQKSAIHTRTCQASVTADHSESQAMRRRRDNESLLTDLVGRQTRLQSIKERFVNGFNADDGDGSPPDPLGAFLR